MNLQSYNPNQIKRPYSCLIIDLDETLLRSYESPDFLDLYGIYTEPSIAKQFHSTVPSYSMTFDDSKKSRIWGVFRPGIKEFLDFVHDYFEYIILWSAATPPYIHHIMNALHKKFDIPYSRIIFTRLNCSRINDNYHKPIQTLIDHVNSSYYTSIKIDPKFTLILDDKDYTFFGNERNGVLIPPFIPGYTGPSGTVDVSRTKIPTYRQLMDRSDRALLDFMIWLDRPEVRNSYDYRELDKSRIFTK